MSHAIPYDEDRKARIAALAAHHAQHEPKQPPRGRPYRPVECVELKMKFDSPANAVTALRAMGHPVTACGINYALMRRRNKGFAARHKGLTFRRPGERSLPPPPEPGSRRPAYRLRIGDKPFDSAREAADAMGVTVKDIYNAVARGFIVVWTDHLVSTEPPAAGRVRRTILVDGKPYRDAKAAAKRFGVHRATLRRCADGGCFRSREKLPVRREA